MEELQNEEVVEKSAEEDRQWCVYRHTCKINEKVYIGITNDIKNRWANKGLRYKARRSDGSYQQPAFASALDRYPDWDNDWTHEVLFDNLTRSEACDKEIELIAFHHSNVSRWHNEARGYNMTDGGGGTSGFKHTDEELEKMRIVSTGRIPSAETRQKISIANTGKVFSEEHRRNMSIAKQNPSDEARKNMSIGQRRRMADPTNHPMYGKYLSQETRDKLSESHKKENMRIETRIKISEKAKARLAIPENNPRYGKGTPVVQFDNNWNVIGEYITTREAERDTGINHASISRSCKHFGNKLAGGFRWMYKEDYEKQLKNLNNND